MWMRYILIALISSFLPLTAQLPTSPVAGGGGTTTPTQVYGDFWIVRTDATHMVFGQNCTTVTPCRVRFGVDAPIDITASATITSSAGTGTVYMYIDRTSGRMTVGHSGLTLTCDSNCDVVDNITGFDDVTDCIPLWQWTVSSGEFTEGGGTDVRTVVGKGATEYPANYTYMAAICQGSTANLGLSALSANPPAAACVTGSNSQLGVASFDATTDEAVQGHFGLGCGSGNNCTGAGQWTGNVDVYVRWRAAATSGDAVWCMQTACVADGQTGDPSWNTADCVADTAKGTTLQWNDATLLDITTTGCARGEEMLWQFFRDADSSEGDTDDMSGDADVISIRFTVRSKL